MNWLSSLFKKREEDVDQHAAGMAHTDLAPPPAPSRPTRRSRALPRFRGSSSDQLPSDTHLLDRVRVQLRRAFTPARPIMDTAMLAGRTELLHTMIRAIEDQYLHVVLFGPRGIGKTSILHVLCNVAQESRYLVRYVSCGERTTFDGFMRSVMADIPLLFHASYDPTAAEIEEGLSFADLLDDRPVSVDQASDILSKIAGTRILIVLDEFDRAIEADFRRSVAELIKNVSDRGARVQLIIAGVAHNLTEIIEHVPSIRRNIFGLLVPNMSQDEIAELISNAQAASGMSFTPKALQLISLSALGLPYLASLVGQHAGFAALDRSSTTIDHCDVQRGIEQVVEHLRLRIAPDVRTHLACAIQGGLRDELVRLAKVALTNSYLLPHEELYARPGRPSTEIGEDGDSDIAKLQHGHRLIIQDRGSPTASYRFADDGVPLYIWTMLMQQHVAEHAVA